MRELLEKLLAACPRLVTARTLQALDADRRALLDGVQAERADLATTRRALTHERAGAARLQTRLGEAEAELLRLRRALEGPPTWLEDIRTGTGTGSLWRAVITLEALRTATDRARDEGREEVAEHFRQELVRLKGEVLAVIGDRPDGPGAASAGSEEGPTRWGSDIKPGDRVRLAGGHALDVRDVERTDDGVVVRGLLAAQRGPVPWSLFIKSDTVLPLLAEGVAR